MKKTMGPGYTNKWTVGNRTVKTRKEARNVERINKVAESVGKGDINSAIAIVLKMIGREITKSRS